MIGYHFKLGKHEQCVDKQVLPLKKEKQKENHNDLTMIFPLYFINFMFHKHNY